MRWFSPITKVFFIHGCLEKFFFHIFGWFHAQWLLCIQLVTSLCRLNRSRFSGKLLNTKLGRLFWFTCFGLFLLVAIASFIKIFPPNKSIPFSFNNSWCTFYGATIIANPLLFRALSIKSMLTRQLTKQSISNQIVW